MWKAIQDQIQSAPSQNSEEENTLETKYNDLVQENSVLRQELTDLYEHLTIVDEKSNEIESDRSNAGVMPTGRLIVSNKSKHETELLMKHEALRQQTVVLEKEQTYLNSHIKEQVAKIKDLEGKLKLAQARLLTSDAETVAAVSLRQKIQELKAQLSSQAGELHTALKRNVDLEVQLSKGAAKLESASKDVQQLSQQLDFLNEQMSNTSAEMKGVSEINNQLVAEKVSASKKMEEQHIQLMRQEVDLMTSQTENRHLERKVEAQSKELLKLYETVSNLRASLVQRELELTQEREKTQHSGATDEEEYEGTASPLMRSAVIRSNFKYGASDGTEGGMGKGNRRADGEASKMKSRVSGGVTNQRLYNRVSGDECGDTVGPTSKGKTTRRRMEKQSNTIGDQPLLFGDEEDCLCVFFPNLK